MYCMQSVFAALFAFALVSPEVTATVKSDESPIVITTPLGKIQGSLMESRLGKTIYAFRGIRYAKAPVGELRFQPPVPIEKYEGVYNATVDGKVCPQPTNDPVSEDCLILNVYSTKLPRGYDKDIKRPVIVHMHPGGFYAGGTVSYWMGPQYFMDQDIVLVTFNYRLGSLGFLSTGEKEAPGNNGFKDQVQVLKWIKQNIKAFGGDPDSVTILGYSAGAISVVLHMVSPMSTGLFHKAVAMSCSPTSQWTIDDQQLDLAKKQASFVNCPNDTPANIVKCLKTKSAEELGNSLPKFAEFGTDLPLTFKPVIEKDFEQPRFLTEHPTALILKGQFQKVPFITGITAEEFGYQAFNILNNKTLLSELNEKWEETAPIPFSYERKGERSKTVSRALKKLYFNDRPIDRSMLDNLGQLYADAAVGFGVNRAAKLISQKNTASSYYYKFSYHGKYSHFYIPGTNNTETYGAVHHDDLIYLFYIPALFPFFGKNSHKEVKMVEKLTLLYANFAKYGDPIPSPNDKLDNVKWEPFNIRTQKYLDIGTQLIMREKLYDDRYSEWERLFPLDEYIN